MINSQNDTHSFQVSTFELRSDLELGLIGNYWYKNGRRVQRVYLSQEKGSCDLAGGVP